MRTLAILALLLLSSCATYHRAQAAYYHVKCGGMGGERVIPKCSWRETWRAISKRQHQKPQPQQKEAIRPNQ